jgi:hypothetical protein
LLHADKAKHAIAKVSERMINPFYVNNGYYKTKASINAGLNVN